MKRFFNRIDRWWVQPLENAAGRYGLFRILFSLGYLWHVAELELRALYNAPREITSPIAFAHLLPANPSLELLQTIDMLLVLSLVLLAFGVRVTVTTAIVLVLGVVREGWLCEYGIENGNVLPIVFIPLFALLAPGWGHTYSLDSWRSGARGLPTIAPANNSWRYALTARSMLVLLAVLFPLAGIYKVTGEGTWLHSDEVVSMLMLRRSIDSAVMGFWSNPFGPWIASHASIGYWIQIAVVTFEISFVLLFAGKFARRVLIACALVFHALSALFLMVSFTGQLAVYAIFADWESLWQSVREWRPVRALRRVLSFAGPVTWTVIAYAASLAIALSWHSGTSEVFTIGGRLNWRTIWLLVTPVAVCAIAVGILRDHKARRSMDRRRGNRRRRTRPNESDRRRNTVALPRGVQSAHKGRGRHS